MGRLEGVGRGRWVGGWKEWREGCHWTFHSCNVATPPAWSHSPSLKPGAAPYPRSRPPPSRQSTFWLFFLFFSFLLLSFSFSYAAFSLLCSHFLSAWQVSHTKTCKALKKFNNNKNKLEFGNDWHSAEIQKYHHIRIQLACLCACLEAASGVATAAVPSHMNAWHSELIQWLCQRVTSISPHTLILIWPRLVSGSVCM